MSMRVLNMVTACILAAFAWYIVSEANQMPVEYGTLGPGFFPKLIGGCLGAFAISILVTALIDRTKSGEQVSLPGAPLLYIVVSTVVYLLLMPRAGYLISTPGYLVITGLIISGDARRHWKGITVNGIACSVTLYALFAQVLNVPLP